MTLFNDVSTSATLLGRLRSDPTDQSAWQEFVRRYGPLIYRWCRSWKLQDSDAQDVTQTVLVKLAARMRTFNYDPERSFRAYLRSVAHYAWCDFLEAGCHQANGSGDSQVQERLQSAEARDDLLEHLKGQFDLELFDEAARRVQCRVEPHTWQAFRMTALEDRSGAEVARTLQLKVATVFKAKSKVQKMLQQELEMLDAT